MYRYLYVCDVCNEEVIEEWEGKSVTPIHCGVETRWLRGLPPGEMSKGAYRDGYKRPGFAELREATRLQKEAASLSHADSNRKEIAKEITKMGVKQGKEQ